MQFVSQYCDIHRWPVQASLMSNTTAYLSVCQAEHRSQLFSVWFGDILLYFESLLQSLSLQVWKHRSRPRPLPLVRLRHCVFCEDGIWTYKTGRTWGKEQTERGRFTAGVSRLQTGNRTGQPLSLSPSYMWSLPGKVSWNWCWPDCLLLLLLPSVLIMEDGSLIPGSMEEKYWLAEGWTGTWIPDWRFELTMDVRSVTGREMTGFSQERV